MFPDSEDEDGEPSSASAEPSVASNGPARTFHDVAEMSQEKRPKVEAGEEELTEDTEANFARASHGRKADNMAARVATSGATNRTAAEAPM
ncbi:hypothetical protein RAB80_017919 [Fusarium oxysporum f. sp. vasinfectum]|uniref:Uncharacterized protein n=1 Tax=Fusarium oxysporum f. sp. vasinfectum 25433 TaxID=1089449 RepID=X0KXN2_FUSOX|nr:hypothetical protein FOTG_18109 [Fusarium oxysporum f. sp. vasinfectum 25433]KAK2666802.1 hypothetical protein RAB80_017919 [Fusarium oxysporum f. sp. vasinfectum]KAK2925365.1 hypothetical protein FoTM2_013731 [Fusarium oxysporum f. sp. vasinfectum]